MQHRAFRFRVVAVVCGVTALVAGLLTAQASALEPVVSSNASGIAEHAARGGAAAIPGVDCGSVCTELWLQEHRPIPGQPTSSALHSELFRVRVESRVWAPFRALLRFSGWGTAALIVWEVGLGDLVKHTEVAVPPVSEWVTEVNAANSGDVIRTMCAARAAECWKFYAPTSGWYVYSGFAAGAWMTNDAKQPCATWWPTDVPGYDRLWGTPEWIYAPRALGLCPPGNRAAYTFFAPAQVDSTVEDGPAASPDVVTQTWNGAPTNASELEQRVVEHLEANPLAEAVYAELLDSQTYDQATRRDEDCDLDSGGTGTDPAPERGNGSSGAEFIARYEHVPAAVSPQSPFPTDLGPVHLNWGFTASSSNPDIQWAGFGYRKIKAKHGWTTADEEATRIALATPPIPHPSNHPGRYIFFGPEYDGAAGARCHRVVVVDHERSQAEIDEGAPNPAGIVTSFGGVIE